MGFKSLKIRDSVLDELRTNQLSGFLPPLAIGGENAYGSQLQLNSRYWRNHTVSQKSVEVFVEAFAFAKIVELGGENGLDVLFVGGLNDSKVQESRLPSVRVTLVPVLEKVVEPECIIAVISACFDCLVDERQA